jgi:hypothetical protein
MDESPNEEDKDGFHRAIPPLGRMDISANQQKGQIHNLIKPGKKQDEAEAKTLVP